MSSRLLLDTHVLLWWLAGSEQLSRRTRDAIAAADAVYVSAASAWELAIKASLGKLRAPDDLEFQLRASRFTELPITVSHALAAAQLARHHSDLFDRMLVAQAAAESLTLLTADSKLKVYDVKILFA